MRLYEGTTIQLIEDTIQNRVAEKMSNAFFNHFHFKANPAEVASWRNSLKALTLVIQHGGLKDNGVLLEYQLPLTSKRLDCLLTGRDKEDSAQAVIIELKQWDTCESSDCENEVLAWVGGSKKELLHPSVQVDRYRQYLLDSHTAFYEGNPPILLSSCAYLHNYPYKKDDVLFDNKFKQIMEVSPLFTEDDVNRFVQFMRDRLEKGKGEEILREVVNSRFRPSKKLMDYVGNLIKGKPEYVLLDEQLVVYDRVLASAKEGHTGKTKQVIIIKGGPGTGKSVIAINLMADLLLSNFNAHYATGSKAFTETLRKIIGTRGEVQFKYFNSYSEAEVNDIDVLICDEAHRIRETSNNRFTPKKKRSGVPQINELIKAAKVAVFFIDDNQVVRPNEIGSSEYIRDISVKEKCDLSEYELDAQFRCSGSDAFVNWINNTLNIKRTANVIWDPDQESFDFQIYQTPQDLEDAIQEKVRKGYTGRLMAGFCWPWSKPDNDGNLLDDIIIDNFKRPWDAKPYARRLAPGIPKASFWAYDPNGINQIGCVYTAQGFEFDYAGVIFGPDLVYRFDKQEWCGDVSKSADRAVKKDKDRFIDLVKNTYRVLLSRGLKGCYVYFMDKETENFIRSRMEKAIGITELKLVRSDSIEVVQNEFKNYLPVYSLKAAAGYFGSSESAEIEGWVKVENMGKLNKKMFIAQVKGKSMEPRIRDGDYCIFQANPVGSRQGKIVLAQYNGPEDPDTGGSYTIKRYRSIKESQVDNTWIHKKISLEPINSNYKPIELYDGENKVTIIAEFVEVLQL